MGLDECKFCVHEPHVGFKCGGDDFRYGRCKCVVADKDGFVYKVDSARCANVGRCIPDTDRTRQQSWLGRASMEFIGWRRRDGEWWCPICTGAFKI